MALAKNLYSEATDVIAAGKQITFNIPAYDCISQFFLNFINDDAQATVANIKSSIAKLRLILDGEVVLDCTPTELYDYYQSLGQEVSRDAISNGVLPLYIAPIAFKQPSAEDALAIGCDSFANGKPLTNIQLQVVCGQTITDITNVSAITERFAMGTGNNITRLYTKLISYAQNLSGTGDSTVDTLPRDINEAYMSVIVSPEGGTITKGEAIVNGKNVIQKIDIATMNAACACRGFGVIAGSFNYLFGDGGDKASLPMVGVNDFRLKTTFSVAPTGGAYKLLAASIKSAS